MSRGMSHAPGFSATLLTIPGTRHYSQLYNPETCQPHAYAAWLRTWRKILCKIVLD
jgi:hypothetical protein